MKLSDVKNDTDVASQEFDAFRDPDHLDLVIGKMNNLLGSYVEKYIRSILDFDSTKKLKSKFGTTNKPSDNAKIIHQYFNNRLDELSNEAQKYRDFFLSSAFKEEGAFDTKGFKARLRREIPVINGAMNSTARVMQEYKAAFNRSNPDDLFNVCNNIIQFAEDYSESMTEEEFSSVSSWEDFNMSELEDDNHRLESVIGNGIRATFLNSISPQWFSGNYKYGIFAMYFLTNKDIIGMKSQTSEFTMLKDIIEPGTRTIITEHNFFYPYPVYNYYMFRIYGYLNGKFKESNIEMKEEFRFWYVSDFINFICEQHSEDIRTLLGRDDKEINPHG